MRNNTYLLIEQQQQNTNTNNVVSTRNNNVNVTDINFLPLVARSNEARSLLTQKPLPSVGFTVYSLSSCVL